MSNISILSRLILSCVIGLGVAPTATAATSTVCSSEMSARLDSFLRQSHASWKELSQHQSVEGACDNGYFAEGYSESVVRLLAYKWGDLHELATVVRARPEFYKWAVRHIDETTSPDDLAKVLVNARSCRTDRASARFCKDIADAAEQALGRTSSR